MLQDRERIARDLHDMVIQRLFAAGMSLQAVQGQAQPPAVAERIATRSTTSTARSENCARRSSVSARQTEHRSLSAQLTELVHDRARHLGFEPELRIMGDIDHLPDFLADQLVATVTEGLSNVVRHAQATSACMHIEQVHDRFSLSISDNGLGLPGAPERSGGLSNMMWRAAELGGSCTVEHNEPVGTVLTWKVPGLTGPCRSALVAMALHETCRQRGRFGTARHPEFREQIRDVVLDGLLGEIQLLGDLSVRVPLADEIEDPPLLRSQVVEPALLAVTQPAQRRGGPRHRRGICAQRRPHGSSR